MTNPIPSQDLLVCHSLVHGLRKQYGDFRAELLSKFSGLVSIFLLQTVEARVAQEERERLTEMAAVVAGQLCQALTQTPPEAEAMALQVRDLVHHLMSHAAQPTTQQVH